MFQWYKITVIEWNVVVKKVVKVLYLVNIQRLQVLLRSLKGDKCKKVKVSSYLETAQLLSDTEDVSFQGIKVRMIDT